MPGGGGAGRVHRATRVKMSRRPPRYDNYDAAGKIVSADGFERKRKLPGSPIPEHSDSLTPTTGNGRNRVGSHSVRSGRQRGNCKVRSDTVLPSPGILHAGRPNTTLPITLLIRSDKKCMRDAAAERHQASDDECGASTYAAPRHAAPRRKLPPRKPVAADQK